MSNTAEDFKFSFPRTTFVDSNGLFEQITHIETEMAEVKHAYLNEPPERLVEELVDLYHSVETALRIMDERYVPIPHLDVQEKNRARGYYCD
jgi:hypothetical protein